MILERELPVPAFLSLPRDQRLQVPDSQASEGVAGKWLWLGQDGILRWGWGRGTGGVGYSSPQEPVKTLHL